MTRKCSGDVRDIDASLLTGVDAVVQLAAISNDPMGATYEAAPTRSIAAPLCASPRSRRRRASNISCSPRVAASTASRPARRARRAIRSIRKRPMRARRSTPNGALAEMDLNGMTTTCLRFATACGMSDRLRLDLVLNDFVACAVAARKITVLSDGTPWRPLIDVRDMARAIEWAITRAPDNGGTLAQRQRRRRRLELSGPRSRRGGGRGRAGHGGQHQPRRAARHALLQGRFLALSRARAGASAADDAAALDRAAARRPRGMGFADAEFPRLAVTCD